MRARLPNEVGLASEHADRAKFQPFYGKQSVGLKSPVLATDPRLLFLDEPPPAFSTPTGGTTVTHPHDPRQFNLTIVLDRTPHAGGRRSRMYVLEYGRTIAHGTLEQIRSIPK